jgi:signal transduction histidine kinase/CheY-like chemotaxis protein
MIDTASSPATSCQDSMKLQKIVKVLMDQVERGIDFQGNAYSLFQTAIVLEDKVRERTRRLETALRELEKSNRELSIAKEQTETAQTRLMEAVESISEGFVHFDADDRLVLCNTKFLEFWSDGKRDIREVLRPGVSFREISRWTVETGLIVDVDGDPDEWLRGRLYRHSNPSDPHVVHLASGRWLQIRERQTWDGGTVGIYTDITAIKLDEQQRREQELAEKSILLQSTLDNLAQGVSVFDKHLRLVAWNERFVELLELPDWLVRPGASFQDYLRYRSARGDFGDDGETAIAIRMQHVREREPAKREQMLPNGTVLEMRRDPMPGGGFVTTYTDITDRQIAAVQLREAKASLERRVAERTAELTSLNVKLRQEIHERAEIEEALRLAKGEADKANMSKTRFLAAASHDLLQPLNAARLFVTALSERPLREKEREFATHIDRALGSVESLLGTLLDISKLDAGAVSAEKADFVIGDLISALADEYAPIAKEANLDLIALPCSLVVRSDPALLSRVLRNFISNAIRYTGSGRVLLGCRRRGWRVRIEVWDTGQGIPDGSTDEIFEEFRQLNHHDRAHSKSFGLGLAIVKRISQLLDHPIGVRSKVGKGSVFFVDVPVGALPRALPKHGVCHAVPNDALSSAIAVMIDDQESILDGMRELFLGWGSTAITAVDGRTAVLELARRERRPDIVIADYHLEDGSTGVAAVDEVRAVFGSNIPGLIITADRSLEVLEIVRRRGLHLLKKPVKPAKLRALVSHLLAQGRRRPATLEHPSIPIS